MKRYIDIWNPKSLVIIFVQFSGQEVTCSGLQYGKKNIKRSKIDDEQRFDTLEELVKYFGKSKAYRLHVEGSGVLSRKLESVPNYKEELIISGDSDDFIFTTYNDGRTIATSFFRRALLDVQLEELRELKIHLLGITAGYVPLFGLEESVSLNFEYTLVKESQQIVDFSRAEDIKKKELIDGEYFNAHQLLAKALFLVHGGNDEQFESSESEQYETASENYRQFNQFRGYGVVLLSGILLSLVGNYFYQNHLNTTIAQLESDLSVSNQSLSLLSRLEEERMRKEQQVSNAGVNSSKFLSFYLDEIGKTVPKAIYLAEMEVFPLTGKLKNKRKIEIDQQNVRISGSTTGNEILDDWIERIDRFEWVEGVELLNYSKTEDGRADFIISLTLST